MAELGVIKITQLLADVNYSVWVREGAFDLVLFYHAVKLQHVAVYVQ